MNNTVKLTLLGLLSAIVLTGCGSGPQSTTEKFTEALQSGDLQTLKDTSTAETYAMLEIGLKMQCMNQDLQTCLEKKEPRVKVLMDIKLFLNQTLQLLFK